MILQIRNIRIPFVLILVFVCISNSPAQIRPWEAIAQMQKGINLGNTHEPPTEAGWNNPKAEEYYFDMYKEAGFQCVRIPVRWDNYTGKTPPYTISKAWLDRIEQVVDWGLERDLFIVLNSHHDDWIKDNYSEANKERFDSIWSQISVRFRNKSEKLIFEVLNEPHGLSKSQNDDMHARIISIIRKTNPTRLIIFQGHNWGGSDELITAAIPNDNYVIGSFHSYDPYLFGLEGQGTWGTAGDYAVLENKFKSVKNWSDTHNIPVFLGEFGAVRSCDYNSRMKHYRAYVEFAQKYGFAAVAWDDGGNFRILERQQKAWDEVKDILIHTNADAPNPYARVFQDSIVKITWNNRVTNHDSIIIQRRPGTQRVYKNIAVLKPDTTLFYDIKPAMNQYYSYRVLAHYNDSIDLYSQPFQVFFPAWTKPVRTPFHGNPLTIPGIIEAEDFDKGGEGFTYHDADETNIAGDYRPDEPVDIYDRLGDGFHIGNAIAGEWYEYSVNVETEGTYEITFHLASLYGGGTFQISVDSLKSEELTAPACYSWLNTKPVSTSMYLPEGRHIVRFTVLSDPLFNFDKMVFDLKTGVNRITGRQKPIIAYQNNQGALIIKQDYDQNPDMLKVFSATGGLIKSIVHPDKITEIPAYLTPPGLYIIQSITNKQRQTQKIILH